MASSGRLGRGKNNYSNSLLRLYNETTNFLLAFNGVRRGSDIMILKCINDQELGSRRTRTTRELQTKLYANIIWKIIVLNSYSTVQMTSMEAMFIQNLLAIYHSHANRYCSSMGIQSFYGSQLHHSTGYVAQTFGSQI